MLWTRDPNNSPELAIFYFQYCVRPIRDNQGDKSEALYQVTEVCVIGSKLHSFVIILAIFLGDAAKADKDQ